MNDTKTTDMALQADYEVIGDGRTVWVNSSTGMCVGRFTRFGMDIHHDTDGQMRGKHCLDCRTHNKASIEQSWQQFIRLMNMHYGVLISNAMKPNTF